MSIQYDRKKGLLEIFPDDMDEERALTSFYMDSEAQYVRENENLAEFYLPHIIEEGESEPSNRRFLRVSIPLVKDEKEKEAEAEAELHKNCQQNE